MCLAVRLQVFSAMLGPLGSDCSLIGDLSSGPTAGRARPGPLGEAGHAAAPQLFLLPGAFVSFPGLTGRSGHPGANS